MSGAVANKVDDVFEWTQENIEGLIAKIEPRLRLAFLELIRVARAENTLEELAKLIIEGRINDLIESVAATNVETFANVVTAAMIESGEAVTSAISTGLGSVISFDSVNQNAVNVMQENRLRLVTEFVSEQRISTRAALIDGVRRGLNPIDQARNFRDNIGLTSRQQAAVENYRRLLTEGNADALRRELRDRRFDPTVRRAIRGEIELTDAQVTKMVDRYRERYIKYRAEVIARTEALRAAHEGSNFGFEQAIASGRISAEDIEEAWHTATDARVRDSHNTMNGQKRAWGQPFLSGAGNLLRYPGDINAPAAETIQCRCSKSTRIVLAARRAA